MILCSKPPVKSTEPSKKVIKGYIKIIEGLFDVKLTKKEKEIVKQDVIYMYKHEEEEDKEGLNYILIMGIGILILLIILIIIFMRKKNK